ncbi:uncharacterized protein [Amphiura filiformis]|uniref:uncharacterized protein n=1 Tax=Amphiura filiformis TaxID=82378 RepID=UPI003B2220C9
MATGSFSWAQWAISKAISLAISLVASGLSALKRASKTTWKGVKGAASGIRATNFAIKNATNATIKTGFKTAAKYAVQEVGKQIVMRGVSLLWDEASTAILERIFKKYFYDTIKENLKRSRPLNEIMRAVIEQNMPTNPSELDKDKLNDLVKYTCDKALGKVLNKFPVFNEIGFHMDRWTGLMSAVASKKSGNLAQVILIGNEMYQYTRLVTELVQDWPTADYMKGEVASALAKEIEDVFQLPNIKNNADFQKGQHSDLHDRLYESVCEIVTDGFTGKITHLLVSISKRHACQYVSGKLGTVAANALDRADVNQQLIDQSHSWEMKVDAEDSKPAQTKFSQEEVNQVNELVREATDPSNPANDLHLNILVQSGLIEGGRGIIIDIVDEKTGKLVTSNQFEGKPGTEPIRLRLTQTKEGERSFLEKCSGKVSSYSGHFQRLDQHGNVVQGQTGDGSNQNCLFDAIAHGTGTNPNNLRRQVGEQIKLDPGRWREPAIRQHQFSLAYSNSSLFLTRGGKSIYKQKTYQSLETDIQACIDTYKDNGGTLTNPSEEEQSLQLGRIDEYNSRRNDPNQRNIPQTQQDHIPAKGCLDPKSAGQGLAMTVRTEHHKAALSTGNGKDSKYARDYVKSLFQTGNENEARLVSYAISHPEVSNYIRQKTGFPAKEIGSHSTRYYTPGFLTHAAATLSKSMQVGQDKKDTISKDVAYIKSFETPSNMVNTNQVRGLIHYIKRRKQE